MKILKMSLYAVIGAGLLAGTVAHANLIVNPSFEDANLTSGGDNGSGLWDYFYNTSNPLPGWTSTDNSIPLEVGLGTVYGVTGYDGNNVMELDSTVNVAVDQNLVTAGGTYQLSFLYALRSGVDPASGTMQVYWDNNLVASLSPTSSAMTLYTTSVTATGSDILQFDGTGISDSYGAILDNVSLTPVPEATTMIAGALLLLPLGVSTFRILRKSRMA
jgi:hypothetical protein